VAGLPVWPGVVRPLMGQSLKNKILSDWPKGGRTTPSGPGVGLATPWAKRSNFRFAQGAAKPPRGPLGVVQPPPNSLRGCGRTTPGQTGWSNHPIGHHLWGGSATPAYLFIFFKKKSDGGILGINRLNGLSCHNLKVWGGKVSHFKLWRQK
jgi:hypothetical protein